MSNYEYLIEKAFSITDNAYVPYSSFKVGACIEMKDGTFVYGVNVENAAYGSTMCAERNAIYSAYTQGYRADDIKALAIVAFSDLLVTPCGACRQVLGELLNPDTPIILATKKESLVTSISELLPLTFTKEHL